MGFIAGKPKTGGRRKGVTNKRPPIKQLDESLGSARFDLGEQLLKMLNSDISSDTRLKVLTLIARYTQQPVKIEESKPDDESDDSYDDADADTLVASLKSV